MRWHEVSQQVCAEVLARVAAEGPMTATQLGGAKGGGPWWDWSEVKVAAEWLLDIGDLVCVRRTGWRRVYDLAERVVPADLLNRDPSDEECVSHLVRVAARALGVATRGDLTDYHRLQRLPPGGRGRTEALDDAARTAGLAPVHDPGGAGQRRRVGRPGRAVRRGQHPPGTAPGHAAVAVRLAHLGPQADGATVRLRAHPGGLRAEGQTRAGYFVMPLLAGGRLVGRVDPVRRDTTLVARQVSLDSPSAAEPMARALREAAEWVGCDRIELERVEPAASETHLRELCPTELT